ncbi:protein MCM10 homolog [Antedon mediterranea]|uniref:protein MCM10 homolog n=1 Tax=Antedon mediterranea TaxID=105859 RepID=UPI003AF54729
MGDEYDDYDDLDVLTSLLGDDDGDANPYDVKPDVTKFKYKKSDIYKNGETNLSLIEKSKHDGGVKKRSSGSSDEDKSKHELLDEMEKMKRRMQELESQLKMKEKTNVREEGNSFAEAMDAEVEKKKTAKCKLKDINKVKKKKVENDKMTELSGITSEDLFGCDDDWNVEDDENKSECSDSPPDDENYKNTSPNSMFNKNKQRTAHSPNTSTVLQEKTSPYKCSLCDMQFNNFDSYNLHQFQHRKESSHECKNCNKSFTSVLSLKVHLRSHSKSPSDQSRTPTTSRKGNELNCNNKRTMALSRESGALKGQLSIKKRKIEEDKFETDGFSQIRIVNPLISSSTFKQYIGERKFIRMSIMKSYLSGGEIEGNWVTCGVIISKTPPKTSAKGKLFSIWKMSDLRSCNDTTSLFLFGKVHEEHWKTQEGSVIGILNASVLPQRDNSSDEISLTVDNHQKLLLLGRSKDIGFCKAKKKSGQPCGNFVNKHSCEYCKFHVQKEYQKMTSKRAELQSSYAGVQPKANWKGLNKDQFMYGGKSFNLSSRGKFAKKSSQSKLTVTSLGAKEAEKYKEESRKNVLVMHSKLTDEKDTLVQVGGVSSEFKGLLNAPTPGAQNVLRHLVKAEKDKDPLISVSAKDLLKQHKMDMKKKIADRKIQNTHTNRGISDNVIDLGSPIQFYKKQKESPNQNTPQLGRGFKSAVTPRKLKTPFSLEEAKRQAVAVIRAKGELSKTNPNKLYKGPTSEKAKKDIMNKVAEDTQAIQDKENDESPGSSKPKKRIILGQEVEFTKEDIEKIAKTKSLNASLLSQFELEMQEEYFKKMEVKEGMEKMMDSVKEKEVNIVSCKQCKYTWFKASDLCKKENHQLKWHEGKQRFFTCKDCKTRCITFDRIPNKSCRHCKGTHFERASMLKEKKGPLLDSEKLLLRGEERKWVN